MPVSGHTEVNHARSLRGVIKGRCPERVSRTRCVALHPPKPDDRHTDATLGSAAAMLPLRLFKGSPLIAEVMRPHGKDDADPDVGQGTDRNCMAFALRSFALIVLVGPRFTLGALPSELMQGVAQGFNAPQAAMGFGVHSALIQNRGSSTQSLQTASILVAGSIIRFPPRVVEPGVDLHAASFQRAHGPHGSKKGCQSPCRTAQFARAVAAADLPAPASDATWCGS